MEIICVDTDIIIDFSNGYTTALDYYLQKQESRQTLLVISSISVFEFFTGISKKKYEDAELLIKNFTVKDFDENIAKIAAQLNRKYNLTRKIGVNDIYLAATSIHLKAKLLTKNIKHFKQIPKIKFAQ